VEFTVKTFAYIDELLHELLLLGRAVTVSGFLRFLQQQRWAPANSYLCDVMCLVHWM